VYTPLMVDATAVLLGLGLGLCHATEADHIAAVSTLLRRGMGSHQAARVAALWGLGHAVSFLGVGLCIVVLGLHIPPAFEHLAGGLVSVMLIGLGAAHLTRGRAATAAAPPSTRPVAIGVLHGLAGSAAVALIAATTIQSRLWASLYLAFFGVGTIIGMSGLTFLLSGPLAWAGRQDGALWRWALRAPGIVSISLGALLGVEALATVAN
jgi:nickel/cobalt exporter